MEWETEELSFDSRKGQEIFFSPKRPARLWVSPSPPIQLAPEFLVPL